MAGRVLVCFLQLSQYHGQNKVPGGGRVSLHTVLGLIRSDDATEQYVIVQSMPN